MTGGRQQSDGRTYKRLTIKSRDMAPWLFFWSVVALSSVFAVRNCHCSHLAAFGLFFQESISSAGLHGRLPYAWWSSIPEKQAASPDGG